MSKGRIIIIVIASIGVVVSAVMFVKSTIEYRQAEEEYAGLEQYVTVGATEEAPKEEGSTPAPSEEGEAAPEEDKKVLTRNYNRADFPDISVDHDALSKINASYVCWLYAPGADINHPVVQGTDNEFYLHHTFEMKKNSSGCVFLDHEVDPALTSRNTFFYGHNMKNGTMFGHLKNYINNKAVYDKNPYIYVFRPEGIYRYEIFSYYLDQTDSKMYYTCKTFKEYRAYLREATKRSVRECTAKCDPDTNIVTLVTCSGSGSNKQRFFVHGVFKDYYLY
ncbi:MAG: class B sortase [Lachnospiraceae bacterium]|nr:class B sortase [Lachnospiraceae bacterium]